MSREMHQSLYSRSAQTDLVTRIAPAARWRVGCVLAIFVAVIGIVPQRTSAAIATLGVVDFYALSPIDAVAGVIPERAAADDLSTMLARAGNGQFTVIPRAELQQAEADVRWHEADVLRFERLRELAQRVGADRLVVGWLEMSVGKGGGSGGGMPRTSDSDQYDGFTSLVVQVFDAGQGRIVAQRASSASTQGLVRPRVVEQVLHLALEPLVKSLLSSLTPPP